MSFLVIFLCGLSALLLSGVILSFSSMSLMSAFLLSLVIIFFCAGGLAAKEALVRRTGKFRGRFVALFVVLLCLTPATKPYLGLWQTVSGFWSKLFLVWLAALALMVFSLATQMGEPGDQPGTSGDQPR